MSFLLALSLFLVLTLLLIPLSRRIGLASTPVYLFLGLFLGAFSGLFLDLDLNALGGSTEFSENLFKMAVLLLLFMLGWQGQSLAAPFLTRWQETLKLTLSQFALIWFIVTLIIFALISSVSLGSPSLIALLGIAFGLSLYSPNLLLELTVKTRQTNSSHPLHQFSHELQFGQLLLLVLFLVLLPWIGRQISLYQGVAYLAALIGCVSGFVLINQLITKPFSRYLAEQKLFEMQLALAILMGLLILVCMQLLGVHIWLGAFFAGILIADLYQYHQQPNQPSNALKPIRVLLLGLSLTLITTHISIEPLLKEPLWVLVGAFILIGVKYLITFIVIRIQKLAWQESNQMALAFSPSGELALIVLYLLTQEQVIQVDDFNFFALLVLFSCLTSAFLNLFFQLVWSNKALKTKK